MLPMGFCNIMIRDNELPVFDALGYGWGSCTRHGMIWELFEDKEKQMNPDLYDEALEVVKKCILTGQPPFGGWR